MQCSEHFGLIGRQPFSACRCVVGDGEVAGNRKENEREGDGGDGKR